MQAIVGIRRIYVQIDHKEQARFSCLLTRGSDTSNLVSLQEVLKQANEQANVQIRGLYS